MFPMIQTPILMIAYPRSWCYLPLPTYIFDGPLEQGEACTVLIAAVLYSAPRLETLWRKHFTRE